MTINSKLEPTISMYASREEFEAAMEAWLESEVDTDYYDAAGNTSPGGLYDIGGHPIPERWADYADYISDRD
jgi:hypothetical protein